MTGKRCNNPDVRLLAACQVVDGYSRTNPGVDGPVTQGLGMFFRLCDTVLLPPEAPREAP